MSVSVGAIGAVSSGQNLYSVLSPYLNGVVRTSDAATLAQADALEQTTNAAVAQAAIAARGDAAAAAAATPPFANPAITALGERLALGEALGPTLGVTPDALLSSTTVSADVPSSAATPAPNSLAAFDATARPSATNSVLTGDSGLLVQSYDAVALLAGVQAPPSVYGLAAVPAIPAPAQIASLANVRKVA